MDKQTDIQTDRRSEVQTNRRTDRQKDRLTDKVKENQKEDKDFKAAFMPFSPSGHPTLY